MPELPEVEVVKRPMVPIVSVSATKVEGAPRSPSAVRRLPPVEPAAVNGCEGAFTAVEPLPDYPSTRTQ